MENLKKQDDIQEAAASGAAVKSSFFELRVLSLFVAVTLVLVAAKIENPAGHNLFLTFVLIDVAGLVALLWGLLLIYRNFVRPHCAEGAHPDDPLISTTETGSGRDDDVGAYSVRGSARIGHLQMPGARQFAAGSSGQELRAGLWLLVAGVYLLLQPNLIAFKVEERAGSRRQAYDGWLAVLSPSIVVLLLFYVRHLWARFGREAVACCTRLTADGDLDEHRDKDAAPAACTPGELNRHYARLVNIVNELWLLTQVACAFAWLLVLALFLDERLGTVRLEYDRWIWVFVPVWASTIFAALHAVLLYTAVLERASRNMRLSAFSHFWFAYMLSVALSISSGALASNLDQVHSSKFVSWNVIFVPLYLWAVAFVLCGLLGARTGSIFA
jgi:hypothetical protein